MGFLNALGSQSPGGTPAQAAGVDANGNPVDANGNPIAGASATTAPYQAAAPGLQLQNFGSTLQQALANYGTAAGNQNALVSQLQAQEQGAGPNPAQQQLLNTTQQNAQNQAAAVAAQRGINPALAARQIDTGTSALNQTEAGQAALLRQQQELQAQNEEAGVLGNEATTGASLFGSATTGENAQNSGQAQQTQLGQQAFQENFGAASSLVGSALNGAGTGAQALGQVGGVPTGSPNAAASTADVAGSPAGTGSTAAEEAGTSDIGATTGAADFAPEATAVLAAKGGRVGEGSLDDTHAQFLDAYSRAHAEAQSGQGDPKHALELLLAYQAGQGHEARNMETGGRVGGKAKVAGDSPKNDTKPVLTSPGEDVIPRTIARSPEKTAGYVRALNREEAGDADAAHEYLAAVNRQKAAKRVMERRA